MRWFIACSVLIALLLVGVVVHHAIGRKPRGTSHDGSAKVMTVSTGGRVELESHVASSGLTIVEFTADF